MNIDVICPLCGHRFMTSVTERETRSHDKRLRCSACWKSFNLARALWRPLPLVKASRILPVGQVKISDSRRKARNKFSKKAASLRAKGRPL